MTMTATTLSTAVGEALAGPLQALPVALIARICLVAMFPFSALDKIVNRAEALAQARSSVVPAAWAPLLLAAAAVLEFVAPVCIVVGWMAEPAALLLALFCIVTALLFHPFWRSDDLLRPGPSSGRTHFWDFTKNFGLAGGLLLVAAGRGF
ncbi:DoxX family membrane protein [Xylophilus sp. Kf1]|nr:DoxX family membrane protein [Xylophilus sp. Kf1]